MKTKLTKQRVERFKCPEGKSQAFLWDEELAGFAVRVTKTGILSYVVQGRTNGKESVTTIGRHGVFTCDQAREEAREVLRGMRKGVAPQAEKARKAAQGVTLREVMNAYLGVRDLKASSKADIEKHVNKSFLAWADKPVTTITRDACSKRFKELSERGKAQANQAFVNLRALLNYARATYRTPDGLPTMPENPVSVLSDAKLWNKTRAKSTRIPNDKIGEVWSMLQARRNADDQTTSSRTSADIVSFLMLTGARWNEAAMLTWDNVNLEKGWWHLPDPKNSNPVWLPLSKEASELLAARPHVTGNDYVFPARSGGKYIVDARSTMERVSELAGEHLSPHDLRRTFVAVAMECKIEMWKFELLTNHVPTSVTAISYMETKKLAYLLPEAQIIADWIAAQGQEAERVAQEKAAIAAGENVIQLRA